MTEMTELKPCPFCGNTDLYHDFCVNGFPKLYVIGCTHYSCRGNPSVIKSGFTLKRAKKKTIKAWNKAADLLQEV